MSLLKPKYGMAQVQQGVFHQEDHTAQLQERSLRLMRVKMVERLTRLQGLDNAHQQAMLEIPRHLFTHQSLYSRAYEEMTIPIGFGQTMSRPSVVARLLQEGFGYRGSQKNVPSSLSVLEIGTGCGYLAALLAQQGHRVTSIERITPLYHLAMKNLAAFHFKNQPVLILGDGQKGTLVQAPFDVVIISAACQQIPLMLVDQLAEKGRMVFPLVPFSSDGENTDYQHLTLVEKFSAGKFHTKALDKVQFVPLLSGIYV
jgi:protein-L-isoaspartate(D-aspartate) O-methyltransferase